ncbi:hypothetical protein MNBD_DELTA01-1908 [hydrothermal vent metagenome]|uniref:TRASH domain-containing protein n=1 Tax=hydrothermal vent metagenome TaxID=652676 RepID=A0A3B0RA60_9ZZZZ
MIKFVVLIVLGFVAYGLIKKNISSGKKERAEHRKQSAAYNQRAPMPNGAGEVEAEEPKEQEETVFDSICMSYIPIETAVGARVGKTTHYFCSEFCRRTYVNTHVNAPY